MFDRVLALLHEAVFDATQWPAASALIDEACGTAGNGVVVGEGFGNDVRIYSGRFYFRGERRQDLEREYFKHYHPRDERLPRLRQLPDRQLVHVPDLFTEAELKTSPVYNEGLLRLGSRNGLIMRLDGRDGLRIVWALGDPVAAGGWKSAQVEAIERLVPHIRHYVQIRSASANAGNLGPVISGWLDNARMAVLHLDRRGRIVEANDRARDLLRSGSGLIDRDSFLGAALPDDDPKLQSLLARVLPPSGPGVGGTVTVRRPAGPPHLALYATPVDGARWDFPDRRTAALVLVVPPLDPAPLNTALVAQALHLTPAESQVAAGLAQGRTVRQMALSSGRREDSIRFHLKRIYRKHGLTGQADLVRLVLSLRGLSPPHA